MNRCNIILIVVDTLRADHLHCYGSADELTPNIDDIARNAARFENVYSSSNFTAPAFASLFTALYPAQHGVYDFRIETLPASPFLEMLKEQGYARQAIVDFGFFKSFLGESFDAMESLTDLTDNWSVEGPVIETQRAIEWIKEHRRQPFCLFFHISPPHVPYRFPDAFRKKMETSAQFSELMAALRDDEIVATLFPEPEGGCIPEEKIRELNECIAKMNVVDVGEDTREFIRYLYSREVALVDELIGSLVDELKSFGLYEHTILSFSSDHGEQLWDHSSFGHGMDILYNEIIKTPWIVSCPGKLGARRITTNVSHVNILPTLIELAGLKLNPVLASKSVFSLLKVGSEGMVIEIDSGDTPVYSEAGHYISVIHRDYKLISLSQRRSFRTVREKMRHKLGSMKRHLHPGGHQSKELYHLYADPRETMNMAGQEGKFVKELQKLIDDYYKAPAHDLGKSKKLSREEEERIKKELRGLGYY